MFHSRDRQNAHEILLSCVSKSPLNEEQLKHLCRRQKNWRFFMEQVRWHRVAALAWRRLRAVEAEIPADIAAEMRRLNRHNRLKTLKHFAEIKRLSQVFDEADTPLLTLKGPVLSLQLHGDPSLRSNNDVDLLVTREDMAKAMEILRSEGYSKVFLRENLPRQAMEFYLTNQKDFSFYHYKKRIHIELHWDWCTNKHMFKLPVAAAIDRKQHIPAENTGIPAPSDLDNWCYLLAHIFVSSWARLSWLSDFDSIFRSAELDWQSLQEQIRYYQLENAFYATVLLTHNEYGTPVPTNILETANSRTIAKILYILVRKYHLKCKYPPHLIRLFANMLLNKNIRYQLHNLSILFISVNDIAVLPLPRYLYPLYFLLRPFLWTWRHLVVRKANQIA